MVSISELKKEEEEKKGNLLTVHYALTIVMMMKWDTVK